MKVGVRLLVIIAMNNIQMCVYNVNPMSNYYKR